MLTTTWPSNVPGVGISTGAANVPRLRVNVAERTAEFSQPACVAIAFRVVVVLMSNGAE
jgi:hypothetical protein